MKKITLIFLAIVLLAGCANPDFYQANHPTPASIQGEFVREGLFTWKRTTIVSIDNKRINYGLFSSGDEPVDVAPGVHTFVVHVEFLRAFGDGPYSALIETTALMRPSANYVIQSAYQGNKALVWVATPGGHRISSVSSGLYQYVAPRTVVMPVIVN